MKKNSQSNDKTRPVRYSTTATFISALLASCSENLLHPVDTAAKRFQNNKAKVPFRWSAMLHIACPQGKFTSLFDGIVAASTYRIIRRSTTFFLQPLINDSIQDHYGKVLENRVGEQLSQPLSHAFSGVIAGLSDTFLLPLDQWRIRQQTSGRQTFSSLVKQEGLTGLYRGVGINALLNIKAWGTFFGVTELTKSYQIKNESNNFRNNFIASILGATSAVIVTHPADTIKTRLFSSKGNISSYSLFKDTLCNEGKAALFKGIVPRACSVIPRITMLKVIADGAPPLVEEGLKWAKNKMR